MHLKQRSMALLLSILPIFAGAQELAFPGAEGFGALASGGRGGEVVHVTNLNDAGPGSLREALSQPKRIIVFDVGGIVNLKNQLVVPSNTTIAGQTAPGEGIVLYGHSVSFSNQSNVIVRYVRFREGIAGPERKCSVNINKGSNMIFDHCSIQWGRWDCIGVTESSTITFQNCIIGEAIAPQRFGAICETDHITFSNNLWINNQSRNPKAKGKVQYVNNVIYNYGGTGLGGGHSAADHWLDCVNNYFIKGPNSGNAALGQFTSTDKVFSAGNFFDDNKDGQLNGRAVDQKDYADKKGAPDFLNSAHVVPPTPVKARSAADAFAYVLDNAGASLKRDAIDARLIAQAKSLGTEGKIVREESEVGGHPSVAGGEAPKDTDRDGMPDAWETAAKLNPNDPSDASGTGQAGYSNVEMYLNSLVK